MLIETDSGAQLTSCQRYRTTLRFISRFLSRLWSKHITMLFRYISKRGVVLLHRQVTQKHFYFFYNKLLTKLDFSTAALFNPFRVKTLKTLG